MSNIKFVYFDVGGVLLEYEHAYWEIAQETGKSFDEIGEIIDTYAIQDDANTEQLLRDYKRELGLNFGTYQEFVDFYTSAFIPIQSTHDLIKELIGKYPLGLLSNTEPQVLETSLKVGKIPDVTYKTIVASCYVGYRKPDKEIYDIAQERAGVPEEKILFIDDAQVNLNAAKALGWQTVLFDTRDPENSIKEIRGYLV